jgi:hypothetical protein
MKCKLKNGGETGSLKKIEETSFDSKFLSKE